MQNETSPEEETHGQTSQLFLLKSNHNKNYNVSIFIIVLCCHSEINNKGINSILHKTPNNKLKKNKNQYPFNEYTNFFGTV